MARAASHDEVKRAFLARALRFHPDRQRDATPAARERAEFRMREINAAWAVLRNPSARASYDDELRADELVAAGVASAGSAGVTRVAPRREDARFGREPDEVADLQPASAAEPVRTPRFFTWGPVLLGGSVLVLILMSVAFGAHRPNNAIRVQTVEAFAVGTCVTVASDEALGTAVAGEQARQIAVSVPCSAANVGRVASRESFPKSCPSGSRALLLVELRESLCLMDA